MRTTPEDIESSIHFERVPDGELPKPVVYRDKRTGNMVFIVSDGRGGRCVLDSYCVLKDFAGKAEYCRRETRKFFRRLGNVFKAVAGILIHATDPRLTAILRFAGAGDVAKKIGKFVSGIGGQIDKSGVTQLLAELDQNELLHVHTMMKEALRDEVFTVDEWKAIEAKAASFQ